MESILRLFVNDLKRKRSIMNIEIFLNKIIKLIKNDDIIKKYLRKTAKTTGTRSAIRLEKEEKTWFDRIIKYLRKEI